MSFKAQRTPFSARDGNSFSKSQRSNTYQKADRKVVKVYLPKEESSTHTSEQNEFQQQAEVYETKAVIESVQDKENVPVDDHTSHWQNVESVTETDEKVEKTEPEKPTESAETKSQKKRIRKKKESKDSGEDEKEVQQDTDLQVGGTTEDAKQAEEETKEVPQQKKGKKAKEQRKSSEEEAEKLDENQKKIRNLKKKLKQIELLEDKRRKGETLNEDEVSKIGSKREILITIKDLSIK